MAIRWNFEPVKSVNPTVEYARKLTNSSLRQQGTFLTSPGEKSCPSVDKSCFVFRSHNSRPKQQNTIFNLVHRGNGTTPSQSSWKPYTLQHSIPYATAYLVESHTLKHTKIQHPAPPNSFHATIHMQDSPPHKRFLRRRMQLTLHASGRTPHGASLCLVQAMSAWSVKTRRAPSRLCRDARVYGHTTTVMHGRSVPFPHTCMLHLSLFHSRTIQQYPM